MTQIEKSESNQATDTSTQLFILANRVLSIVKLIVILLLAIVVGLISFYLFLLTQQQEMSGAAHQLKDLILTLWQGMTPYVARFISLVAPVFVLIFALGLLHRLGSHGASPFDMKGLLSDLPSTLALIIIATICLLPLAGLAVPDVLNNIALVVVGFYFGKRKTSDEQA